jgi:hypothetical protein
MTEVVGAAFLARAVHDDTFLSEIFWSVEIGPLCRVAGVSPSEGRPARQARVMRHGRNPSLPRRQLGACRG